MTKAEALIEAQHRARHTGVTHVVFKHEIYSTMPLVSWNDRPTDGAVYFTSVAPTDKDFKDKDLK